MRFWRIFLSLSLVLNMFRLALLSIGRTKDIGLMVLLLCCLLLNLLLRLCPVGEGVLILNPLRFWERWECLEFSVCWKVWNLFNKCLVLLCVRLIRLDIWLRLCFCSWLFSHCFSHSSSQDGCTRTKAIRFTILILLLIHLFQVLIYWL